MMIRSLHQKFPRGYDSIQDNTMVNGVKTHHIASSYHCSSQGGSQLFYLVLSHNYTE
jgi:hypothetical protein